MMTSYKYRGVFTVVTITLGIIMLWLICEKKSAERLAVTDDVPGLVFSRESGFYDEEFDLEIRSASGTVYYTMDGTDPTTDSILYTGPIHIIDASVNENVYSLRTDISTGFYLDLLDEFSFRAPGYTMPSYPVDKCTIIRAVVYYGNGRYSQIKTASFLWDMPTKKAMMI